MREVPNGIYRVAVTAADIGRRVSLRRVLRDGRDGLGDVVGELIAWENGELTVRTRGGALVLVVAADLVSAKIVPAPPERRR